MQYYKLTQSFTTGEVKAREESKAGLSSALLQHLKTGFLAMYEACSETIETHAF